MRVSDEVERKPVQHDVTVRQPRHYLRQRVRVPVPRPAALLLALLCLLLAAGCGTAVATPVPATLRLAASSSALPLAQLAAEGYHNRYPHITVDVQPVASELAAHRLVEANLADAALVGMMTPLDSSTPLSATLVATDALVIAVHRDNPLVNLSLTTRARCSAAGCAFGRSWRRDRARSRF